MGLERTWCFLQNEESQARTLEWVAISFSNAWKWKVKVMLLQSCPTLCDPIDGSPTGSPVPGILQARTLEWVAMSFSSAWKWKLKVKSLSRVRLFATPWTVAYQAPPSMGCSRQEFWSGVPLPSPQLRLDTAKQVFWFQLSPFCGQWGSCTCEGWLAVYMGKQ